MQSCIERGSPPHYLYLDFLRFFAASLVMFYHFTTANHVVPSWPLGTKAAIGTSAANYELLIPYFSSGWVGVEIFFVISGFVIASSTDGKTAQSFIQNRILRLYPVIVITTLIAFCISVLYSSESLFYLVTLGLKQIFLVPKGPWLDGVFWTLIVEVMFYGFIGSIVYLRFIDSIERIVLIWGCLACLCALAVLGAYVGRDAGLNPAYKFGVSYLLRICLISTGPFFVLGYIIHFVAKRGITWWRCGMLVFCFIAGATQIFLTCTDEQFYGEGAYSAGAPVATWAVAVMGIVWSAWTTTSRIACTRCKALARRIGLMTFPLYLIHNTFGAYVLGLLSKAGVSPYPAFGIAACLCMVVSYVISKSLEPVLRTLIRTYVFGPYDRLRLHVVTH